MLKRLELVGFKSFADKTTFDFGDGVTAIVGPNGSGKSNIVDAVRWILGEQSAKSLRGGEMADVIFNGSSIRRGLGLAEVTMTFDNRRRQLPVESEEVQFTRRVYRSGEGEYLINGQPARLRDIKELFLGSGAGHDAYCIIEQGKVDVLLQASTNERRIIFEEAAGISRFKAKKIETLRKLERVDQNVQRLRDIIDEVEKQLRSVKLQAAKAQRYKEYSDRLKELRLEQGLRDYNELTDRLGAESKVLEGLRAELAARAGRAVACEAESERLEILLADLEDDLHQHEGQLAAVSQRIRSEETTLIHESSLTADLEKELERTRRRLTELAERVTGLAQAVAAAETDLTEAETKASRERQVVRDLDENLGQTAKQLRDLHVQAAQDKNEHLEQMRRSAHLQNDAVASKAHVDNLRRERDRLRHRSDQVAESLASIDLELEDLTRADDDLQSRVALARQQLTEQRQESERLRQLRDRTAERISTLRQERSGLASRIEVLDNLIKSHEGLGTGVREVLAMIEGREMRVEGREARAEGREARDEEPEASPLAPQPTPLILGMIADFLTVKREYAPLIDLALGDWAQRFLVRDVDQLIAVLEQRQQPFSGRVSFLPLAATESDRAHAYSSLRGNRQIEVALLSRVRQPGGGDVSPHHPGMVAPAEQVVSCDHPELAELPAQLLGRTLIVRDLATARAIAAHTPGFRLITLQGELLEPEGTLTVGTHHAETGILSRRSELLDLKDQIESLDQRLVENDQDLTDLRERVARLETAMSEKQEEIDVLTEQAADLRNRLQRHRERRQGLHDEVSLSREEMQRLDEEIVALESDWHQAQEQAAAAEAQVQILHVRVRQADDDLRHLEQERQRRQGDLTAAQVALAKVEERVQGLGTRHQQLARDLYQRHREQQQGQQVLTSSRERLTASQLAMLNASSLLAHLFLEKEGRQSQVAELTRDRDNRRQDRARLAQLAQTVRGEWRVQQEHVHNRELETKDHHHKRVTLMDKLREDYQIDIAALSEERRKARAEKPAGPEDSPLAPPPSPLVPPLFDEDAANEEIEDLRRKLSRLGSVNLESLQELHELETRSTTLQAQWQDLTTAKKSLEEIIAKINGDSRLLFVETFNTIRTHFQELFRKLFGGGMADIVLEDQVDILESGIEIIARPPGKELRSISLMSGGEKTMTAVALLLAIFRSKPSPFCLLDEVDAALDEANIGRFTDVLREFLDQSQFIIVTHSKKTMACADVLYGITMQESGISKQVAVRFEDWVDDIPPTREAQLASNGNGHDESFAGR